MGLRVLANLQIPHIKPLVEMYMTMQFLTADEIASLRAEKAKLENPAIAITFSLVAAAIFDVGVVVAALADKLPRYVPVVTTAILAMNFLGFLYFGKQLTDKGEPLATKLKDDAIAKEKS